MFELTVSLEEESDPPDLVELSSTYFFVAASLLDTGDPAFVSFFQSYHNFHLRLD